MHRISIFINRGEWWGGRDLHYLTKKPNNSDDQHEYLNKGLTDNITNPLEKMSTVQYF